MKTGIKSARSTLILVRHAHTAMAGCFCGHSDPPLSPEGLALLPVLNEQLPSGSFTHLFSSDLQRARQTAQAIAKLHHLKARFLPSLREIAFGSWEGMNWDQVVAQDAAYAQKWLDEYPFLPAPGGENFEDFGRRIQGAINAIADEIAGGSAVVVTHGGVIRTFRGYLAGPGRNPANFPTCDYASRWEVVREHDQWRWLSQLTSSAETAGVSQ